MIKVGNPQENSGGDLSGVSPSPTVEDLIRANRALVPAPAGRKDDGGKLPLELIPWDVVQEVAKVLQFGAKKYAPNNWRKGLVYSRVYAAILRHMLAWWHGETADADTGLSPLAHAACELFFLMHYELAGRRELDDRAAQRDPAQVA